MINSRLAFVDADSQTYHGTVRYSGTIHPTSGTWIGVEWDDVKRGKHSGVYKPTGARYFDCSVEGSGSFLRPNAKGIQSPRSFAKALLSKYGPASPTSASHHRSGLVSILDPVVYQNENANEITVYSTSSNFNIEAVVSPSSRQPGLDRLREIGLERECIARCAESLEEIEVIKGLKSLDTLNLSQSLLDNFNELDSIIDCIPSLRNLILNSNRFARIPDNAPPLHAFQHLTLLKLNKTLMRWDQIVLLAPSLPSLIELQLGSNSMTTMKSPCSAPPIFPRLRTMNLENNLINSWDEIVDSVGRLPSLRKLILTSNRISLLTAPSSASIAFQSIESLALASNQLEEWDQIDTIQKSFKGLKEFWIADNPFLTPSGVFLTLRRGGSVMLTILGCETSKSDNRLKLISKLPFLISCEGSLINDSERLPRATQSLDSLLPSYLDNIQSSRLITLRVLLPPSLSSSIPHKTSSDILEAISITVLPTLSIRSLRIKISKSLPNSPSIPKQRFRFVAVLSTNAQEPEDEDDILKLDIPVDEESRELGYWGIEDGDEILLVST